MCVCVCVSMSACVWVEQGGGGEGKMGAGEGKMIIGRWILGLVLWTMMVYYRQPVFMIVQMALYVGRDDGNLSRES